MFDAVLNYISLWAMIMMLCYFMVNYEIFPFNGKISRRYHFNLRY